METGLRHRPAARRNAQRDGGTTVSPPQNSFRIGPRGCTRWKTAFEQIPRESVRRCSPPRAPPPGPWSLVPNPGPGRSPWPRHPPHGPWFPAPGPWRVAPGPWSLAPAPALWPLVPGPWSLVRGPWSLVPGHGSLVSGLWSLVFGPWSLFPGFWSLVLVPVLCSLESREQYHFEAMLLGNWLD